MTGTMKGPMLIKMSWAGKVYLLQNCMDLFTLQ